MFLPSYYEFKTWNQSFIYENWLNKIHLPKKKNLKQYMFIDWSLTVNIFPDIHNLDIRI